MDVQKTTTINILSAQPAPQTTAEYEAIFERLIAEAESIHEQMGRDRIEIERLKVETQIIRDETRTLLADMDTTQTVQQGQWEQRCARDRAARDRENIILRMANSRLRADRGLPPYDGNSLF